MNILTDALPETVEIDGKQCKIRADFRTWIKAAQIFASGSIDTDKIVYLIDLIFGYIPPKFNEMWRAVMDFYCPPKLNRGGKPSGNKRRYDYDCDADMICAAFMQQYGIDLTVSDMHWYRFRALFENLDEQTQFVKVMQYRSVKLSDIKDKEQRNFYRKMQQMYKLPDNRTEQQKQADFEREFAAAFG